MREAYRGYCWASGKRLALHVESFANATAALLGYGTAHVDGVVQCPCRDISWVKWEFHAANNICGDTSDTIRTCLQEFRGPEVTPTNCPLLIRFVFYDNSLLRKSVECS